MAIDAARYRQIIGHFATGVTVVTTAHDGWLHGMTANALSSVSLNPLMLLVCVDKSANAHEQIAQAGKFAVNILAEEQEDISRIFAAKTEPQQGSLHGVDYSLGRNGTPIIEGAVGFLECDVTDRFEGGDHTIFLGTVVEGDVMEETRPLLFYRGGYRRMA